MADMPNWKALVFAIAFLTFLGMNILLASPENRLLAAALQSLVFFLILTSPSGRRRK